MSETETPPQLNQKKEIFDLPLEQRKVEAARIVNEMKGLKVGVAGNESFPVELTGNGEQATAFLDLVYTNTEPDKFGLIVNNVSGLRADGQLAKKINESGGVIPVRGGNNKDTTIVMIDGKGNDTFSCKFGYSAKGSSLEKGDRGINININGDSNTIPDESLYKLYKMTGKPDFVESVGIRAEMKGKGASNSVTAPIDPEGYYSVLGLNPYALKFLDQESFEGLVRGMKLQTVKRIHPDTAGKQPSEREVEYFQKVLKACDTLENTEKRKSYSAWLK